VTMGICTSRMLRGGQGWVENLLLVFV